MSTYQLTKETFLKDVAEHQMEVLRDEGVYRHLRFKQPGTMCMHFDLITWPGYLCYAGDMGTFVFTRVRDMLEFFRPSDYAKCDPLTKIDRRYWAEKIDASDRDGVTEFDPAAFKAAIHQRRIELIRDSRNDLSKHQRRELWNEIKEEILDKVDDWTPTELAHHFASEFSFSIGSFLYETHQRFSLNLDEFPACKRYTDRFLWCCYALRWAVMKYDEAKAEAPAAALA